MGGVDEAAAVRTLHHALDQGVTLIDTAEAYRTSEETIGKALASWSGQRERLFVATKVRGSDLSRAHVMAAIEQSLRALGLEQVDLLQAHSWDAGHPIEETMRAFETSPAAARCATSGSPTSTSRRWKRPGPYAPSSPCSPATTCSTATSTRDPPYCHRQGIGVLAHSPPWPRGS